TGTENFFADDAFFRWIQWLIAQDGTPGRSSVLVLNGDIFDFLRYRRVPEDGDYDRWVLLLQYLQCAPEGCTAASLRTEATRQLEREFGLDTEDYKSVWKLYEMRRGHPAFFAALAQWLGKGHRLYVTRGNHDVEWHWAAVRRCFLWILAEELTGEKYRYCAADVPDGRQATVVKSLAAIAGTVGFAGRAVVFDQKVDVEHGNLYDTYARITPPYVARDQRLNIPVGSEFNRYLLNRLELAFPYLDKVRPSDNVFSVLLRERFPLA